MALKKSELYSSLWQSCDELRGGMDAFSLLAFHHRFKLDQTGTDAGDETDVQLSRKFGQALTATAKYADFRRESPAFPNVRKLWLQIEFVY